MADYEIPSDCLYTREDEWVRMEGHRATIGVTDYAQDQLGDIVFIELPEAGAPVAQGDTFGVIESVKAVSDLYAPLTGTVLEANADLAEQPELVNASCYADGWMIAVEITDPDELEGLLTAEDYAQYVKERQD